MPLLQAFSSLLGYIVAVKVFMRLFRPAITPTEVSRVIAKILGIRHAPTRNATPVFDPTCGSESLLLKVGDEATAKVPLDVTSISRTGKVRQCFSSGIAEPVFTGGTAFSNAIDVIRRAKNVHEAITSHYQRRHCG
jgi:hypothetical protein